MQLNLRDVDKYIHKHMYLLAQPDNNLLLAEVE